jgi:hypothetical protein
MADCDAWWCWRCLLNVNIKLDTTVSTFYTKKCIHLFIIWEIKTPIENHFSTQEFFLTRNGEMTATPKQLTHVTAVLTRSCPSSRSLNIGSPNSRFM